MRAAVEEVTLAHSVITELDSLAGRVTCNIETNTIRLEIWGSQTHSASYMQSINTVLSRSEDLQRLELKTLYASLPNKAKTTNTYFNALQCY